MRTSREPSRLHPSHSQDPCTTRGCSGRFERTINQKMDTGRDKRSVWLSQTTQDFARKLRWCYGGVGWPMIPWSRGSCHWGLQAGGSSPEPRGPPAGGTQRVPSEPRGPPRAAFGGSARRPSDPLRAPRGAMGEHPLTHCRPSEASKSPCPESLY